MRRKKVRYLIDEVDDNESMMQDRAHITRIYKYGSGDDSMDK